MEYYPIYLAIKTWSHKRPFLALLLFCLSLVIPSLIYIKKSDISIAGTTFEESLLNTGIHEVTFKFDKDIIKLDTYENNTQQWLDTMGLSFDPPQEGSIRTISGDSFSFVFNTPVTEDVAIHYNDSLSAKVMIHHQNSTSSPFILKKNEFQISHAFRDNQDLNTPITVFANQPLLLSTFKDGISISKTNGDPVRFAVDYDISTNTTISKITCIQTNYNVFNILPYSLKTDTHYLLAFDYGSVDLDKDDFGFEFSSYAPPSWDDISQDIFMGDDLQVGHPLWIRLNNQIHTTNSTNSTLVVTPEVPNLSYTIYPYGIKIEGDFISEQTYSLDFTPNDLYDVYNQPITSNFRTEFSLIGRKPSLSQVKGTLYIDRENPVVRFQTVNVTNVTITYQYITSAYYTAVSLYGRNVPVETYRTNFSIESPKDIPTWQEFNIKHLITNKALLVLMNIQDANNPSPKTNFTKILATTSSFTAHISTEDLLLQVKDIKTQDPHELMMISIWDPERGSFQDLGRTKSDGTLRVPYPKLPLRTLQNPIFIGMFESRALFEHVAFLTSGESIFNSPDGHAYSSAQLFYNDIATSQYIKAMISTDRPSYQLGEDIHVNVIARAKTNNNYTSKHTFFDTQTQIRVLDSEQKVITNFYKRWSSMGAINFDISKNLIKNIGTYSIHINTPSQNFRTQDYFTVESLKVKNSEILFQSKSPAYRFGEHLDITLEPKYLFGENIATTIDYNILGVPIAFQSKKYHNYYFGDTPTQDSDFLIKGTLESTHEQPEVQIQDYLEGNNNLRLHLYAKADSPETSPISLENYSIQAFLPIQLGIHNAKTSITNYEELDFHLLAIDPITEDIVKHNSTFIITKDRVLDFGVFSFITNFINITPQYKQTLLHKNINNGKSIVKFIPEEEGVYQAKYSTFTNGVEISTEISFVVIGSTPPIDTQLSLELDKPSYVSGEQAILYIKNPFEYAELLLIVEKDTIREYHYLVASSDIITHTIPLTYQDEPGLNITAILSSDSEMLYGTTTVKMSPINKKLQVIAQTSKSNYMPNEEVTIDLSAYNNFNQLIDGEALVIVRDRAVLNSSYDSIEDPIDFFYNHREKGFTTWSSLKLSFNNNSLTNPKPPYPQPRTMEAMAMMSTLDNVEIRSNFPYTIYYNSAIPMSKDKKNSIKFTLPDSISGFDVTVLVHDDGQLFGKTNIQFTSSKQLIVDDILPKFLRPKDQVVWGAYIRNFSKKDLQTTVLLDNRTTTLTQEVFIPENSFVTITNTSTISDEQTNWRVFAVSDDYQDAISKNIPIISENPWLSSSYASLLNYHTNITIPAQDLEQQSLHIQVATTPTVNEQLQELLETQSLSLNTVTTRLSVFLTHEKLILSNSFITNTREQLRSILQKDLDRLRAYYSNSSRVALVPNGSFYSSDPMYLLQIYDILLSARQNNYIVDKTLLDNMERIALPLSRNSDTMVRAYALNILASYKMLTKESYNNVYPYLVNTADTQALILDTMHKLGCSLKNISDQTEKVSRYTSTTSSSTLINSRFLARILILYYGTYSDGIKILNAQPNDLFATLAFMTKYPKQDSYSVDIFVNDDKHILTDSSNSLRLPIDKTGADIILQTDNTNSLFYNIVYSYVPEEIGESIDSGYKITKKIIDPETKEEVDSLEINKTYTVEIAIKSKMTGSQQVEIIDPLYAGTILSQDGLTHSDDKVYLYTTVSGTTLRTVSYRITTTHQGIWTAPPTSVNLLRSPEVFGIQPQPSISIK